MSQLTGTGNHCLDEDPSSGGKEPTRALELDFQKQEEAASQV